MYSTGLPVLYPFAFLFYFVLYWVYKGLLLKYYARTTKFNQEIPIESMFWFKVALFFHIFIGSIMLSNQAFFPAQEHGSEEADEVGEAAAKYLESFNVPYANNFIGAYFVRLTAGSQSAIYFAFIVILVIGWVGFNVLDILLNFFGAMLSPIFKCINKCCACCCKKKSEVKSKDFYKELTVLSLDEIYQKAKSDQEEFEFNVS